jgi:hypothetical protein
MPNHQSRQTGMTVGSIKAARMAAGLPPLNFGATPDSTLLGATTTGTQVVKPPVSSQSLTAMLKNAGLA